MSEDKKTASVWDYDQAVIKNLQIHTSYIGGLQRITSKFILRSTEEDQLRLPTTIEKFNKLVEQIDVDYDNSDMVELSKQVAQGKIDKDLAAKVDAIASKLKIVK